MKFKTSGRKSTQLRAILKYLTEHKNSAWPLNKMTHISQVAICSTKTANQHKHRNTTRDIKLDCIEELYCVTLHKLFF